MTTLQDKLDNIYNTKLQIKSAIGTDSDVFSDYPEMIRNMSYGGVSYAYLDERLSYYVEIEDLNEELSYYVSLNDLESMTYATQSYVVDYVTTYGSGEVTYAYLSENYLPLSGGKMKGSVNLGSYPLILKDNGSIYISTSSLDDRLTLSMGDYAPKYEITSYGITPIAFNEQDLGTDYNRWEKTYTNNLYTSYINGNDISNLADKTDLGYYLNTSNLTKPSGASYLQLWTRGLSITSGGSIYPAYLTTANVDGSWYADAWIASSTLRKYVADKLSDNIIPKENNTYSLGDSSYKYTNTYSGRYTTAYSTWIGSDSDYEFHIGVNGTKRYQMNMYQFYQLANPDTSSLGVSNHPWAFGYIKTTYTDNIYNNTGKTRILTNDRNFDLWTNNKKLINLSDYNGFIPMQSNFNLGSSDNIWGTTYTASIYTDNAYISSATYLPVNTYWYDGSSYHWLGSLFN